LVKNLDLKTEIFRGEVKTKQLWLLPINSKTFLDT